MTLWLFGCIIQVLRRDRHFPSILIFHLRCNLKSVSNNKMRLSEYEVFRFY